MFTILIKEIVMAGEDIQRDRPIIEIDADEFYAAQRDPRVKAFLGEAAAYGEQVRAEGRDRTGIHDVTVIDHDELVADSQDPAWQHALKVAEEHVEQLRREGRSD
jgi:hypothetical protein